MISSLGMGIAISEPPYMGLNMVLFLHELIHFLTSSIS